MQTQKIIISGMHCTACAMNIDFEIEDLDGVSSSSTNYAQQYTSVTYDPSKVSIDTILHTIRNLEYEASIQLENE
ncbi:MAG: Zinc-transporting ATPase [Microgenomates bacterium OLB23]|nr:MAG: Zinc-transporting ATPase [Microgenomates bacterium OLB23]